MKRRTKTQEYYDSFETFDLFLKNVKIPQKLYRMFENFIDDSQDTFGNAVKSYHKAGYSENSTSKYTAKDKYNSPIFQRLLTLYRKKTAEKRENASISVFDRVHNDLLWSLDTAKERNDYNAVRAITMDIAKLHGILVEKHQVIDPAAEAEVSRIKQIEAARIAELSTGREIPALPDNIIEATFEAVISGTNIDESTAKEYNIDVNDDLQAENEDLDSLTD